MKLRHRLIRRQAGGSEETLVRDFDAESVVLGRGGASDLVLGSSLISITHARLSLSGTELILEDLRSLGGTYVNGRSVQRQPLRSGDEIKLGDVVLRVSQVSGVWELQEIQDTSSKPSLDELVQAQLAAIDVGKRLPSKAFFGLTLMGLVAVLFLLWPATTPNRQTWSSGSMSLHHGMIGGNCAACHEQNFRRVSDQKCLSCHALSEHVPADNVKRIGLTPAYDHSCVDCHQEHGGNQALLPRESKLCATCHADLSKVAPKSVMQSFSDWNHHPEFKVDLPGAEPGALKVSLSDKAALTDNSHIKLNHHIHLQKNLRGKDGPVTLQCTDCHHLSGDGSGIAPISMGRDCQSCHGLGFDDRLAGREVPHGSADVVYKFLYAEYAKLFLAPDDVPLPAGFNRLRPGEQSHASSEQQALLKSSVEKEARTAEGQLFTKTACFLCHEVNERNDSMAALNSAQLSRYAVLKPEIPDRWMPPSRFEHAAHESVTCESCHSKVHESTKTQDVLIPVIATCRECHSSGHAESMVQSDCVMCHSYHDSLPLPGAQKRRIEEIVKELRG